MGDTVLGKVYPNQGQEPIILRCRVCNLVNITGYLMILLETRLRQRVSNSVRTTRSRLKDESIRRRQLQSILDDIIWLKWAYWRRRLLQPDRWRRRRQ